MAIQCGLANGSCQLSFEGWRTLFNFEEVSACVIDPCRHQKSRCWWALICERLKWNVLFYLDARRSVVRLEQEPTLYSMYCIIGHSTILTSEMALCNSECCIMPSASSNAIIFFPTPCLLLNETPVMRLNLSRDHHHHPPPQGHPSDLLGGAHFHWNQVTGSLS